MDFDVSSDDASSLDPSQYADENGNPDTSKIEAEAERRGLSAAQKDGFIADLIRRVSTTVAKGKKVIDDAETGAEYGSVVPVFGTAAGTIAGAAYGVYTEFGDDIKSALGGGPRWSEDDYNRMRKACRDAGGQSVPGKPPNNLDACIFPDGTLSGGDTPVWAAQAEYEADQKLRALNLTNLSSYIDGIKQIDGMIAAADAAVRKAEKARPGSGANTRAVWVKTIGDAFGAIYNATKLDSSPPANVAGFLKDNNWRIYTPPPLTSAQLVKLLKGAKVKKLAMTTPAAIVKAAAASKLPTVHMTIIAAKNGDAAAQAVVAATVTAAEKSGAPAATVQAANAMSLALKIQKRAAYVTYWLYGDGAKKLTAA